MPSQRVQRKPKNGLLLCKTAPYPCFGHHVIGRLTPTRPSPEAAVLLAVYDFNNANKLLGSILVSSMPNERSEESPFASFLSLTSYLLQHAYRSTRVTRYAE